MLYLPLFYVHYFPFGMRMWDRSFNSSEYKYGFQGQEKDDEIKGEGNSINYKYRIHDPRVGRFFAVDPLASKYPHNSPYAFSENRVLDAIELEGLEAVTLSDGETVETGPVNEETQLDIIENSGALDDGAYVTDYGNGTIGLPPINIVANNPIKQNQSTEKNDSKFLANLEITAGFSFGASLNLNYGSEVTGGASLAEVNLIGLFDNNFYFGGRNLSNNSTSREVNKYTYFSARGHGISKNFAHDKSRNGTLIKVSTQLDIAEGVNFYFEENYIDSFTVRQLRFSQGLGFGLILTPQIGFNLILFSDTIKNNGAPK